MKSSIVKRSIVLAGHKTSVSLEEPFYQGLKDIAASRRVTLSDLVAGINTERENGNLSSAIRCSCSITIRRPRHHLIEASWHPTNNMPRTDSAVGVDW